MSVSILLFFAIVFGLSVLGMFIINELSSNSITILNYREEIINEYSTWEAELNEWEAELREREKALEP
jgi:predicted PurR-regulated permease PerM